MRPKSAKTVSLQREAKSHNDHIILTAISWVIVLAQKVINMTLSGSFASGQLDSFHGLEGNYTVKSLERSALINSELRHMAPFPGPPYFTVTPTQFTGAGPPDVELLNIDLI